MDKAKSLCAALVFATVPLALIWKLRRNWNRPALPPGPRGLPFLGNVLNIPRNVPVWLTFTSLSRKFNTDVLYIQLFTKNMIILNSPEAVSDLIEKRSNIYSDRPQPPMLKLMGISTWNIALFQYGPQWRNGRRLLHEFLNVREVPRFDEYQLKHAHRFLHNLTESPNEFFHHVEFLVGALVMEMTYGMNIASSEDKFLATAVEGLELANRVMLPGAFLVDSIPILKHIPEWFPGAGFKAFARTARKKLDLVVDGPLNYVKESMKSGGRGNVSIVWSWLERTQESPNQTHDESVIRVASATMFVGAMDTTAAILHTFFLAMALNPHVVRKAQAELDKVAGGDRLPSFSDEENLPYVSALLKEVLRWGCPVPVGGPKTVTEDDIYNGYFIPAGATIIENVWAMLYDESVFPAPHTYDPERYLKDGKLDPSIRDPEEKVFGFGRRNCPGRYFSMRSIFLNVACVLYLFDIEAPVGEDIEVKFHENGFLRHPAPFKCTIRPRSEASLSLIRSVCASASDN